MSGHKAAKRVAKASTDKSHSELGRADADSGRFAKNVARAELLCTFVPSMGVTVEGCKWTSRSSLWLTHTVTLLHVGSSFATSSIFLANDSNKGATPVHSAALVS